MCESPRWRRVSESLASAVLWALWARQALQTQAGKARKGRVATRRPGTLPAKVEFVPRTVPAKMDFDPWGRSLPNRPALCPPRRPSLNFSRPGEAARGPASELGRKGGADASTGGEGGGGRARADSEIPGEAGPTRRIPEKPG